MKVDSPSLFYTLSFAPSVYDNTPGHRDLNEGDFTSLDRARDVAFEIALELGVDVWITEHFGASSNLIEIIEG